MTGRGVSNSAVTEGIVVQKYGGTSVKDTDRIKKVAQRVADYRKRGDQIIVVVSAMGGVTDRLIGLANEIMPEPTEREMDMLLATGEQTTLTDGFGNAGSAAFSADGKHLFSRPRSTAAPSSSGST